MASQVMWYGRQWQSRLRNEVLVPRLHAAAEMIADKVRENISVAGPPHSTPGNFPHMITGELHGSIEYEVDEQALSAAVYATADHAPFVEHMRPFLSRTVREMRNQIGSKLSGG